MISPRRLPSASSSPPRDSLKPIDTDAPTRNVPSAVAAPEPSAPPTARIASERNSSIERTLGRRRTTPPMSLGVRRIATAPPNASSASTPIVGRQPNVAAAVGTRMPPSSVAPGMPACLMPNASPSRPGRMRWDSSAPTPGCVIALDMPPNTIATSTTL